MRFEETENIKTKEAVDLKRPVLHLVIVLRQSVGGFTGRSPCFLGASWTARFRNTNTRVGTRAKDPKRLPHVPQGNFLVTRSVAGPTLGHGLT